MQFLSQNVKYNAMQKQCAGRTLNNIQSAKDIYKSKLRGPEKKKKRRKKKVSLSSHYITEVSWSFSNMRRSNNIESLCLKQQMFKLTAIKYLYIQDLCVFIYLFLIVSFLSYFCFIYITLLFVAVLYEVGFFKSILVL